GDDDNDDQDGVDTAAKALSGLKVSSGGGGASGEQTASEPVDSARKMKALNKKIRQVEELEAKVASGEVVPTEEQRQKLARKPALVAELAEVGEKVWNLWRASCGLVALLNGNNITVRGSPEYGGASRPLNMCLNSGVSNYDYDETSHRIS
ncbi:unnamed protein product, partial [Ectocarpus fasciculatus]